MSRLIVPLDPQPDYDELKTWIVENVWVGQAPPTPDARLEVIAGLWCWVVGYDPLAEDEDGDATLPG